MPIWAMARTRLRRGSGAGRVNDPAVMGKKLALPLVVKAAHPLVH